MVNSPFSRFNIGSLEPAGSFRSLSMGGMGTAMRDNNSIFFSNPASYSSLDTNSFVFDFGIDYGINMLSDGTAKHISEDLNFNHLMMGFPIAKGFGVTTGIVPLSNGYYRISEIINADGNEEYTVFHAGEGGFTKFFLGSGINVTRDVSAGINMTLLFGNLKRSNEFIFEDYYNTIHNTNTENLRLSGMNFDYGIQYNATVFKDFFLTAGASLNIGKYYKSRWDKVSVRFTAYSSNDTISYDTDNTTSAYIPGTMRIGLSFGKKNKFVAGLDYVSAKWSEAKIHGADGYLADTRSFLFGAEYIPEKFSNYSFIRRMEYRLGGHIEDNYLILDGAQVKESGISIGVGIPMPRSLSKTNVFLDFTRKSGAGGSLIHNENYITMGVSLNFYDFWFRKFKYN